MKNEIKKVSQFEKLSETTDGYLVSGFSTAAAGTMGGSLGVSVNISCPTNSGNCVAGCGVKTAS